MSWIDCPYHGVSWEILYDAYDDDDSEDESEIEYEVVPDFDLPPSGWEFWETHDEKEIKEFVKVYLPIHVLQELWTLRGN